MARDISYGQMESSTLVNSKKTNAMAKESSSGKMVENTKVAGSEASNLVLAIIKIINPRVVLDLVLKRTRAVILF